MMSLRLTALLALAVTAAAPPAQAQQAAPPAAPSAPQIETLDQVLDQVAWDAARRGPLLVVDPKNTRQFFTRSPSGQPFSSAPPRESRRDGYDIAAVAAYFGRKVVPVGTLSVLAPTTMTVLNTTNLPRPDPLAGLRPHEKQQLLLSTLSPLQWRKLGSREGLGAGDLSREQRAIFLSLLPDPFVVEQIVHDVGGGAFERATLTPQQRANVRIFLRRQLQWTFETDPPGGIVSVGASVPRPEGTSVFQIPNRFEDFGPRTAAFGVPLLEEVPNRLKPGHLNFAAPVWDAPVSLVGAATVGDLVTRVAAQAKIEMYADPRYRELPVVVRGQAARAGDVLKALCWAVTGTFRQVGPAFVLTDDVKGLGTRHALLYAWIMENETPARDLMRDVPERLRAQQPAQYVGWDPGDPLVPDADLLRQIEAHRQTLLSGSAPNAPRGERGLSVPVSALPPVARQMVQEQLESYPRIQQSFPEGASATLWADRVRLDVQMRLAYLVPGVGEAETPGMFFSSAMSLFQRPPDDRRPVPAARPAAAPAALPSEFKTRALLIAPKTAEEAQAAAAEARRRGLNQLWVQVPEVRGNALLADAVAAGKEAGLPVVAVVPLLRASAGETEAALSDRDVNILEQPTGWWRVDTANSAARIQQNLLDLADVPGIVGLVLRDTAAPGYVDPGDGSGARSITTVSAQGQVTSRRIEDLGYTPEMRLAFLRQAGLDPLDLSPTGENFGSGSGLVVMNLRLPFFPDYGPNVRNTRINNRPATELGARDGAPHWNTFRHAVNTRLLTNLHGVIRAKHPNLPLLIQERTASLDSPTSWFGSWDKAEILPRRTNPPGQSPSNAQTARSQSQRVLVTISASALPLRAGPGEEAARDYASRVQGYLGREKTAWDGLVLDLSGLPVMRALSLLGEFAPPQP